MNVPFAFVIPPTDLTEDTSQNIMIKNIVNLGEKTSGDTKNLNRITFSGFFPNINSYFYKPQLNPLPPIACSEFLKKMKDRGEIFKFLVPQWAKFLTCKIENFSTSYNDHTGDIYYNITLVEYRGEANNILNQNTGLFRRSTR